MAEQLSDTQAIKEVIGRQFASMTWVAGGKPNLHAFESDFVSGSPLYPSARPVRAQSIREFCARMSELARTSLPSFHERVIGIKIDVFGNVAIAAVACENTENENNVSRNVEMMLLVKEGEHWKIAAQAWDRETTNRKIPDDFLREV